MCPIALKFNQDALLYTDSQHVLDSNQSLHHLQKKCFRFETETQMCKWGTQHLHRKKPQNNDPDWKLSFRDRKKINLTV